MRPSLYLQDLAKTDHLTVGCPWGISEQDECEMKRTWGPFPQKSYRAVDPPDAPFLGKSWLAIIRIIACTINHCRMCIPVGCAVGCSCLPPMYGICAEHLEVCCRLPPSSYSTQFWYS